MKDVVDNCKVKEVILNPNLTLRQILAQAMWLRSQRDCVDTQKVGQIWEHGRYSPCGVSICAALGVWTASCRGDCRTPAPPWLSVRVFPEGLTVLKSQQQLGTDTHHW